MQGVIPQLTFPKLTPASPISAHAAEQPQPSPPLLDTASTAATNHHSQEPALSKQYSIINPDVVIYNGSRHHRQRTHFHTYQSSTSWSQVRCRARRVQCFIKAPESSVLPKRS